MKTFTFRVVLLAMAVLWTASTVAQAAVAVSPILGSNMVLQRGKPVPIRGTATPSSTITVGFSGQSKTATTDALGNWLLYLDPMSVQTTGSDLTITETGTGSSSVKFTNVLVGDVYVCGGQSNMQYSMSSFGLTTDINSANFPGIRHITVPVVTATNPQTTFQATSWNVLSPTNAGALSATGFFFARKIYQSQGGSIPVGLVVSCLGGTCIDPWLVQEGQTDIPSLAPLYSQETLPSGPFSLANAMYHPLAPLACKGAIWYQGEAGETTRQGTDSYYLKEKAIQQGWKRLFGLDDFGFYVVQLANMYAAPSNWSTPESGNWTDTRIQQANVLGLYHGGIASAMDIGDPNNIHPTDKVEVGERLALWALKDFYGGSAIVPTGPVIRDVNVSNGKIICSFDYVGNGLMVGAKTPLQPTQEVVGGTLARFCIAGSNGTWYQADAVINADNTVTVSSPSVTAPTKVAYACWNNPIGANLYNKVIMDGVANGLPASPFYIDDVTAKYTVTATTGTGGTISPLGATKYLKRKTALYIITPDPGYYIQDVTVDDVSVGAVTNYTFDPLYTNHRINATFAQTKPTFTITASANTGGSITPSGPSTVAQGDSIIYSVMPNAGYRLTGLTVDGQPMGRRNNFAFTDVRTNHTISAVYAPIPTAGTGTGLRGEYFVGENFGAFTALRTDPTVSFDWGAGSPIAGIPTDKWSVRWQGTIEPQFTETYKFYVTHQDGVRLYINNQLVIDKWAISDADQYEVCSVAMTAGQKVPIKLEYFDYLNNAKVKLEWQSPSIVREVIPQSQLYAATDPIYTISTAPGANGTITPAGPMYAYAGSSVTFTMVPNTGYAVSDITVNGVSKGAASTYTLSNIAGNTTIGASFTVLPTRTVSGKVTAQATGNPIAGATVGIYAYANTVGSPTYSATTDSSGNYTVSLPEGTWYAYASAASYFVSSGRTLTVGSTALTGIDFSLSPATRNIPRTSDLIASVVTDSFPASGNITSVPSYLPSGTTVTGTNSPSVDIIHSVKWEKNLYDDKDGLVYGSAYTSPIPCSGASIVTVIRPTRSLDTNNWRSIVDIFYSQVILGIANNTGQIFVRRLGSNDWCPTGNEIPDGQLTVLSLVIQPDGSYKVWANGKQIWSNTNTNALTTLTPGGGNYSYITIGRNFPDTWTTFNGNIGDVFVYKAALTDAERQQLETDIKAKFGMISGYTITAVAGTGGTITPPGVTEVAPGGSATFTITPKNSYYSVSQVTVDGVNQGPRSTYTFSNVFGNHSINATFAYNGPVYTINASAGTGGTISPAGNVSVNAGEDQTFTITPNSGYVVADVVVDNVSQGPKTTFTFPTVAGNHAISAVFAPYTGPVPFVFYEFEGNVNDSMTVNGNTYNGTAYNTPTYVAGKIGQAIQFNGSNQYVSIPRPVQDSFSISFWVKTTQTNSGSGGWYNGSGLVDGECSGTQNDFGISFMGNKAAFGVGNPDTTIQSTSLINTGQWVHVAGTRDSGTGDLKLYVNGVLEATKSSGPTGTKSAPPTLHLGNLQAGPNFFNGAIDHLKIFNKVLPATDITLLASETNTRTITASYGSNGTISPSGSVTVNYGANQAFTVTPAVGYGIVSLLVDGSPVTPATSYTFSAVTANHTIAANFAKPVGANNKAVLTDPKLVGRVIKVWGKVRTVTGTTSFTINDGYVSDLTIKVNGATLPQGFAKDSIAVVTGVLASDGAVQAQVITIYP